MEKFTEVLVYSQVNNIMHIRLRDCFYTYLVTLSSVTSCALDYSCGQLYTWISFVNHTIFIGNQMLLLVRYPIPHHADAR